tara:strand:- start:504 stop:1172 length:669 start_codon:yes stop_codon:yes gene_type:complete
MTKKNNSDENKIISYLEDNPDFFLNKNDLLINLEIPHQKKGSVSLVEHQMEILQQENKQLKNQLNELIKNASSNHKIIEKIQNLSYKLIQSKSSSEAISYSRKFLINEFEINDCTFVFYEKLDFKKSKFILIKNKTDKSLKLFESFIKNNIPRCNKLSEIQYQFLFSNSNSIRSSALIPLGLGENIGFLAINSLDEERFSPDMSMDYLLIIGKLISNAILRF